MQRRPSTKLRPSPSSVSSHSNTSSLFRDDGFEDDFTSTASERSSDLVVAEIVETERTYVDDLEQIVTGYIRPLKQAIKLQNQQRRTTQDSISTRDSEPDQLDSSLNSSLNLNAEDDISSNASSHEHHHQQQQQQQQQHHQHIVVVDEEEEMEEEQEQREREENQDEAGDIFHDTCRAIIHFPNKHFRNSITSIKSNSSIKTKASDISETINAQLKQQQATTTTMNSTVISASHIKKLFSNLEDIYKFNRDFLYRLEECYRNPSLIAECFVENAAGFDVYTQYCTMYPQVVSTLTELMSDQESAEILRHRQSALNQALPLGSYLLKPVQRILKYHILFQSLIKHTADDDSIREKDRQLIDRAYSVMTNIACHINDMKKKHEHAIRVQEVQSLLHGWPTGPDLTTMGELILEDSLVLYNRPKTFRHLFLFDNVLLITKKKRDGSLWYKGHIACSNLMLIENIEGEPFVFNTVPFDSPKSLYAFQAKNLDKKRDWCIKIKEVIIKSFQVTIPNHVKDILMSLTNSAESDAKATSGKAVRAPDYLERKRTSATKKK